MNPAALATLISVIGAGGTIFGLSLSWKTSRRERIREQLSAAERAKQAIVTARAEGYADGVKETRLEFDPRLDRVIDQRDDNGRDRDQYYRELQQARLRIERLEEQIQHLIAQQRRNGGS